MQGIVYIKVSAGGGGRAVVVKVVEKGLSEDKKKTQKIGD